MPRKTRANYFNFSGGLDTDSSILNRNPITVTDIENCIINTDGSIQSRYGIEANALETPYNNSYTTYAPPSKVYHWNFKDDQGIEKDLTVVRSGNSVSFYDDFDPTGTPIFNVDMDSVLDLDYIDIVFEGNVVYIPQITEPVAGTYNTNIIKYRYENSVDELTLMDSSGTQFFRNITSIPAPYFDWGVVQNRLDSLFENLNIHPAEENNTVWQQETIPTSATLPEYEFDTVYASGVKVKVTKGVIEILTANIPSNITLQAGTNLKITHGKESNITYDTIRNIYEDGLSTVIILSSLPELQFITNIQVGSTEEVQSTSNNMYPNTMEAALGRLFFSTPVYSNRVYYSQIYTEDEYGSTRYYTQVDPFSPTDSSVVASDGGYFEVSGANFIVSIRESSGSLIILAENGVWEAVGSNGIFRADDFVVRKLSSKGCVSPASIERMEEGIVYISDDGVNIVVKDRETGLTSIVRSITDNKLENYFKDLSKDIKSVMSTMYNRIDKELYILFNSEEDTAPMIQIGTPQHYRAILIYKLKLDAWYIWTLSDDPEGVKLSLSNIWMSKTNESGRDPVVDDIGELVRDDAGEIVVGLGYAQGATTTIPKVYLTKYNTTTNGIQNSFGKLYTENTYDFQDISDKEAYTPYFRSAHQTYGDIMRGKLANYVKVLYEQLPDLGTDVHGIDIIKGGCNLRVALDTADSPVSIINGFGQPKQTNYRYGVSYNIYPDREQGFSHRTYKHKVLGRGNIIQFNFEGIKDERFFKAIATSTAESPIIDVEGDALFWEEISEEALVSELEWDEATTYNIDDTCKVTHPSNFHIVGWACELIPTESVTAAQ